MEGLSYPPNISYTSAATCKHTQATQPQLSLRFLCISATKETSAQFRISNWVERPKNSGLVNGQGI